MAINKRKVLDAARKYVQKGAKAKALKEFQALLKLDPRDARLRLEVGDAHRRWGENDKAIETYVKVADQYMKEGFDARAVAVYKQIHNLDAEAYETYEPLSELYQRMGLTGEAIGALQTAADGYHKLGKKPEALALLRKMATLDPTNTASRIKVADLLKQEELLSEAIAEYDAASAELKRQGDADAAASVYERILAIKPDRLETLIALSRNLVERGLGERAESFVKRLLELQPDEPAHYESMAAVYRLQKRDDELADTYRDLAELHRRRGDEDQAREILQRYVPSGGLDQDLGIDEETAFGAMGSDVPFVDSDDASEDDDANGATLGGLGSSDFDELILEDEAQPGADETLLVDLAGDAARPELEIDDDLALELDAPIEDFEIEPVEAVEVGPVETPPTRPPVVSADPDQLLAEASVYLRYGKREQAIENLEAVVAQDASHRLALEKLGEAYAEADRPEQAVARWLTAAEVAREAGDANGLRVLRDRIAALDEAAAATLDDVVSENAPALELPHERASVASVEATVIDMDAIELGETGATGSHEIDLDDIEIDIDDSDFGDAMSQGDDEDAADDIGIPEGVASEPSQEIDLASASSSVAGAGASAAMVQQIGEDLEEADFYMNQGLADEAEAIYQRVLSIAPNHPHALVRLGEVAAMRGEDPASTSAPALGGDSQTLGEATTPDALAADHSSSWSEDIVGPDSLELDLGDAGPSMAEAEAVAPGIGEVTEPDGVAAFDDSSTSLEAAGAGLVDPLEVTVSDGPDEDTGPRVDIDVDIDDIEDADEADDAADDAAASPLEPAPAAIASPDDVDDASAPDLGDPPDLGVETRKPAADANEASFDLAAELEDVFDDDSRSGTMSGLGDSNDGFEAVFDAFKKGVSETLSAGDHEAHFDLGIAYREMGLFDDAKSEFRAAMANPESEFECRHMIGLCCFEQGQLEEAVAELEAILAADTATDGQKLNARFELGRCWQQLGEIERARTAFEAVASVDPSFCEVSERLAELDAPEKAVEADEEALESFEDLISADDDEPGDAVADPPTDEYESFDGFLEDQEEDPVEEDDELEAAAASEVAPAPAVEPEPEPEPEVTPQAPVQKRKKRKISFV